MTLHSKTHTRPMKNLSAKTEDSHFFKWGGDGQPYGLHGEYYATYRTDLLSRELSFRTLA